MIALEIDNLTFRYKSTDKTIFKDLDFDVEEGTITAILGKSGSGKSTLLRCIAGLIPRVYQGELNGRIFVYGEDISGIPHARLSTMIGIVFQNPATQLFSPTVEDELAFGPENLCISRDEIGSRIEEVLRIIGLDRFRHQNPAKLSGGQQQLIAIGSVLTMKPKILLCDEIMSWLDIEGRTAVKNVLKELRSKGTTIVMSDHRDDNLDIADKIIRL